MHLSIVTTLYNSEQFIKEFHQRATDAATKVTSDYEIIYVDDGSPDSSLETIKALSNNDQHIKILELSRNFGHHAAAYAAIEMATGELVFLIDSDLEESPEWLKNFIDIMETEDADLVYGVQRNRPNDFKSNASGGFYRFFNALSETKIPENICTVRLMTSEYKKALLQLREKNLFLAGMFAWVGFNQVAIPVDKKLRKPDKSNYTILHLVKLLVNAVTSFSPLPLYIAFFLGLAISATAGAFGSIMILRKLLSPDTVMAGYASLTVSIFFIGGLIILFLGIIGIYISKIYIEVKNRPHYLKKQQHELKSESNNKSK